MNTRSNCFGFFLTTAVHFKAAVTPIGADHNHNYVSTYLLYIVTENTSKL